MKILAAMLMISFSASFASANYSCPSQFSGGLMGKKTAQTHKKTTTPSTKGSTGKKAGRQ